MNFINSTITILELLDLAISEKINLSPSYQRGFIWSLKDQKDLISTISKGYPLPNLFIRVMNNGKMEMIDGQQRSRTMIKFNNNEIKITPKDNITVCNSETFQNYPLQVCYVHNASDDEIRELYYYINKKGINLNDSERQKAYYNETLFFQLAEELSNNQLLINLDLFSDKSISRFNDREFIQELIGYLYMYNEDKSKKANKGFEGIRDKKIYIEKEMFQNDITAEESSLLRTSFIKILEIFTKWNETYPINETRYKQKSDFYTMFCFLNNNNDLSDDLLKFQYDLLLLLNRKDKNGDQFIRPTNQDCEALKNYAINCVSQSNSKKAREERLSFWQSILLNNIEIDKLQENTSLLSLLSYFSEEFNEDKIDLVKIEDYYLLDVNLLNS